MPASINGANLCAIFAAIGLTVNITWCTIAGHTSGFTDALSGMGIPINPRAFFLLGILGMSIAFAALPQKLREKESALWPAVALLACIGTACFAVAANQTTFPPAVLSIGGLIVFGVGYFWLTARFVLLLARTQPPACSAIGIAVSLAIEPIAVYAVEQTLDATAQVSLVVLLPLISTALFQCARSAALKQRAKEIDVEAGEGKPRTVFGVPSRPRQLEGSKIDRRNACVMVAATALLLATVRSLSFVGLWGEGHIEQAAVPSMSSSPVLMLAYIVLLFLFAYFIIIRTDSLPLHLRFQPSFLIIILTLSVSMILSGDSEADPAMLDTLMRLNDSFSHLLFWSIVVILLDTTSIPSYRVIGAATALYAGASIIWVLFLGNADAVENLIVIVAIYALTLVSMKYTWSKQAHAPATDEQNEDAAPTTDPFDGKPSAVMVSHAIEARCAEVAQAYKLSPRETEILNLLAQGRTRTYIQEELVLAENTIKTHVSHIYAKLGVNDRQDMIDIILDKHSH